MNNKYIRLVAIFFLSNLFLILPLLSSAWQFPLPKAGNNLVGKVQTAQVRDGEDFSDVALRYDLGYYEMVEANPGVDPDNPDTGTELIVPTRYILPRELKPNMILINIAAMRLYFQPKGRNVIYIFPVGIGKIDWDTPTGKMHIVAKVKNPKWVIPTVIRKYRARHGDKLPRVIPAGPENPLGSHALRLSGGNYLIHGTNLSASVGRRSSAGCIHLYEPDIKKLFSMVKVGTPVLIINKPYKAGWQNGKLYLESHLPLFEQRIEAISGDMTPVIDILDAANQKHQVNINWQKAFQIAREHLAVPRPVT